MSDPVTPNAYWTEWLTDSASAAGQVLEGLDWQTYGFTGGLLLAIGIASRYAHLLGPLGGVVGGVVEKGLNIFYPKMKQEANRKAHVMEETAFTIIEGIENLPPTDEVKALKKFIKEKTPDEFEAIFAQWKREYKQRKAAQEQ